MAGRLSKVRVLAMALAVMVTASGSGRAGQMTAPRATGSAITLDVDAADAPLKILHATMSMPAKAGPMSLFYPKWIPGEHMASGPIANLTGLHIFADDRELEWRRDLIETNAFAFTVPVDAKTLTAKYLSLIHI